MFFSDQRGFTLVQAIFILVVLALLGAAMVRLLGGQSATSTLAVQQARAYQAARSGLEWGAARAAGRNGCNGSFVVDNFNVTVNCVKTDYKEGLGASYPVYQLNASATYGALGSPDRVMRQVQMKVGFP